VESGEILEEEKLVEIYKNLQKDIGRTFSNSRVMTLSEEQKEQLQTILGVYSLLDPDISYVQGMNFVVGAIVFAVGDEMDAFGVFCEMMKGKELLKCDPLDQNNPHSSNLDLNHSNPQNLIHSHCSGGRVSKTQRKGYGLRSMYSKSLPGCVVALEQFEHLLQVHFPKLYHHLCAHDITLASFTSEWFMTLFSYVLPLTITLRVFDLFLVDGFKALHRVGLAILSCAQNHLMMLESDDILMYLKQFPDSGIFLNSLDEEDGDTFIQHAMSFKVTNFELHQFCTHLVVEK